jgi:hypothetical protein
MKFNWITLLSGMALLAPAWIGLFLSGVPTVFAPLPALTVIPAFLLVSGHLTFVAVTIPTLLFFAWHPALFKGSNIFPKRTYVLFTAVAVLNAICFIGGWKFGLEYQGARYTYAVCAINVAWTAGLGMLLWRCRRITMSFTYNLVVHWLLFAWLAWYAFPYLGELP